MGQQKSGTTSNALAKQVDASGKIKYDVIARHGHAQDKVPIRNRSGYMHCTLDTVCEPQQTVICNFSIVSYCLYLKRWFINTTVSLTAVIVCSRE